jgi:hypothetical protein
MAPRASSPTRTTSTRRSRRSWAWSRPAFAVHAGFDFVRHLPAVVLAMTVLAGIALPVPVPHSPGPRSPRKSSMKLRRRVAVAILIALLAAGSLAVLAPAGPAVAFSSGAAVP